MANKKQTSVTAPVGDNVMLPSSIASPVVDDSLSLPPIPTNSATQASTIPGIVVGAMGDARTPTLAAQGPSNPVLKLFSRAAGQSADTPKAGALYEGPTTGAEKKANLGDYLKNLSNSFTEASASFGTPQQKLFSETLPEKRREFDVNKDIARGQMENMKAYHTGQLANAANKIDVTQQKDAAAMRVKGYVPDESGAGYRPMDEDEILADPFLSKNRDLSTAALNYKRSQVDLQNARRDALLDPNSLTQQNKLKEFEIKARQADGYLAMARQRLNLATARTNLAGYNSMMNTGMNGLTGEFLEDAQGRGAAPATFADNNGKPVPYKMQTAFIPTSSMRTQQQMAETIEPMIPSIQNDVQRLASKIGPGAGRWNDFWVNRGGTNDPDYAALNTDLSLFATALGKAHFGSRIPQGFVEDMLRQFGEAQSPENLIERLTHADNWVSGYAAFHAKQTAPHTTGGSGNSSALQTDKTATRQHIHDYAAQKGIPDAQAEQEFKMAGYQIK